MDLTDITRIAASGLRAQSLRMRIVAENLANSDSVAATPGGSPYRRKLVEFKPTEDGVSVSGVSSDKSPFPRIYQPGHPAADAQGYVLQPNVNGLVEAADMRAAQRSYEANLNTIEAARSMTARTLDLLK
ncbi:flagellar basal body rod protein FlgC [Sphingomonas sp. KRR8]|uniref:flagellar basal body rod protein FlgC n=1 Tax=Sphingomonas sp. KRR8 TaxID=2942996 RepID=UPI002021DBA7|nr:flagellar basal body rod protein FlgC [Sphingomonas sp. KRR8]URD61911.1 flagellar basal body rod protein FlgC [Sphingomonas sp. KRR8]